MSSLVRRSFLKFTSAFAGSPLLLCGSKAAARVIGANDRVRVAVVGLNGRGRAHIKELQKQPGVEIAYLVDPDADVLNKRLREFGKEPDALSKPQAVADIRQALADKNLDAISVATPNHWHALMTIWGAQAGKHVYVEKPLSHDIREGRIAVAAQEKYGVVVQHGTQSRSNQRIAALHKAIKAGKFGRLKIAYGYCCKTRDSIGFKPVEAPPSNLDWNLWRGPAQINEFHRNYVHYNWHWFWESGNGDLNNQGTHQLDIARWALDDDQTHPVKALALGGRFQWQDQGVTPNTMFALAEYPNGQIVLFNVRNVKYEGYQTQVENEYYFEDGGKIVRGKYYPSGSSQAEEIKLEVPPAVKGGHFGAFVEAIRANKPTLANGNALDSHYSCTMGHVMNNSYRLGQQAPFKADVSNFGGNKDLVEHFGKLHEIMRGGVGLAEADNHYNLGPLLHFDPQSEQFVGEHAQAANKLLKDENRKEFEIPAINAV